jgi:Tol biopolymer transport system component
MKKIFIILSAALVFSAAVSATGKTIASFQNKQYMIGPDIQFSPDGKMISFTAKDGKQYYGPAYIYTGSSSAGSFKKSFNDPVSAYIWKSGSEIIYASRDKDSVAVKSGNPLNGKTEVLYTRKLKMTGSGYARGYEKYNIKAIAPSGEAMIVEKDKGVCAMVSLPSGNETILTGFSIPYSGNPQSTVKFSGDSKRLVLFDGKSRSYTIYDVSGEGLKKIKEIKSINGVTPGSSYILNNDGSLLAFTEEKCKGGCYHVVYIYSIKNGSLSQNITIKRGQILRVAFDRNFTKAVINDMHRRINVFMLKK